MVIRTRNSSLCILALAAGLFLAACSSKKVAKVTPPVAPPPAPAPTASLSAQPDNIQPGQSTVLSWKTTDATDISIEGLGVVSSSGSRSVTPPASRSYTLVAKGTGGTSQASARITVNPASTRATSPQPGDGDLFTQNVKDVFFDFDDSKIRNNEAAVTQHDAVFLSRHSNITVLIEGHCDDRGSEIYNLALGERRAHAVKEALIQQGVDSSRIKTVSYGKEKPFCAQEEEQCWQQNRRDHFVLER
jgi:peptidoglycan-associated lipoprotein